MKELRFKLAAAELVLGRAGYAASARAAQAVLDRYADDPHSVSDDVARAAATVSYAAAVGVTA
ncbi:MAG TPA: hypothetical protein VFQ88_09410 [Nevskiaceae bacterium]|nr:hypothetical protein [Nevskiaceae bacterium]